MRVQAIWNDAVVADSDQTIVVEGNHYFPEDSLDWRYLTPSTSMTVCAWKGKALLLPPHRGWGYQPRRCLAIPEPVPAGQESEEPGRVLAWGPGRPGRRRAARPQVTAVEVADVVVVGMRVGGEAVAGALRRRGSTSQASRRAGGRGVPVLGVHREQEVIRAANLLAEARRIPGPAQRWRTRTGPPVALRIWEEAADCWNDRVAADRFIGKGGRFVRGRGRVLDSGADEVPDLGITRARRALVLATRPRPDLPDRPALPTGRDGAAGTPSAPLSSRAPDRARRPGRRGGAGPGVRQARGHGDPG
jgi:hypothetical protein